MLNINDTKQNLLTINLKIKDKQKLLKRNIHNTTVTSL